MYSKCRRLWHDGKEWWMWEGKRFQTASQARVRYIIMHQLSTVYKRVRVELSEELAGTTNKERAAELEALLRNLKSYNCSHEVDSTLKIMEGEMYLCLASELDGDPDILNVRNGVIDLRTGQLDVHRPAYGCTMIADVDYKGLDHPSPTVDNFLNDIFNEDRALIYFMQRLWGYSINGRTTAELMVFLLGIGGNGKGVCKQMLEATLGDYYGVMAKDAVVKSPGQRPPSKGGATGYLAELRGLRVAITDETSPGERVDLGLVLLMTGGGKVTARLLYKNNVAFRCSHTPFNQTNYDPEIPLTLAKQNNIDRRLIVVRFPNEYVTENKFDASNPSHRLVDSGLKDRMETMVVREEFLSFLVRGSVAWYENPDVLKTHPPAVQAARNAWLQKGDKLQVFLREHCVMDPNETAERDLSVVWEEEFWVRFQVYAGMKIPKEELARQMGEKGYPRRKRRSETGNPDSGRALCYLGFKCEY
ncbi:hypothetical protein KFL_004770035 [Klebsormidium nitens]|uniref:SF3 helicase domain-containing protein n=1 Tax=Klebsormidium nitens TaxID=105231 RepID=A0A1Y1IJS1_KLENI|nr:hypothetical protein KFL_004770035 [Klebsormidium nitens]|eukprot:GAQ88996.1 hypothetical protein KFL_004770035 [Klebsormidium nitens]